MTSICAGGGASQAKLGTATTVIFTATSIVGLLNKIPAPWAIALAGFIGAQTYVTSSFCTTDPPALPTITSSDIVDLASITEPSVSIPALLKFKDFLAYYAWFEMCECASGTQPTPTAPQNDPSGNPFSNPPTTNNGPTCGIFQGSTAALPNGTSDLSLVPPGLPVSTFAGTLALPPNCTTIRFTTTTSAGGSGAQVQFYFDVYTAAGAFIGNTVYAAQGVSTTVTRLITVQSTWKYIVFRVASTSNPNGITPSTEITFYCSTTPGSLVAAGCCPTDPLVLALLEKITGVTELLQRQLAPFAYVPGATHAALTGAGSFAIQGLLGLTALITTLPDSLGREGTSPTEIFDAGWITLGTDDGYPQAIRLEHVSQLIAPPLCSLFTTLAYDLHPGVVLDLVEIKREP